MRVLEKRAGWRWADSRRRRTAESRRLYEIVLNTRRRAARLGLPEAKDVPARTFRPGISIGEMTIAARVRGPLTEAERGIIGSFHQISIKHLYRYFVRVPVPLEKPGGGEQVPAGSRGARDRHGASVCPVDRGKPIGMPLQWLTGGGFLTKPLNAFIFSNLQ